MSYLSLLYCMKLSRVPLCIRSTHLFLADRLCWVRWLSLLHGDYNADQLPKGKLSTKGVGSTAPDPSEFEAVPLGKPKRQRDRKDNEYFCNTG
ncbi:hypothetical protein MKW98_015758 [Papaver atlanticum]|uniref:Uncharacterized protein n=1 Tax=Papaver atlanticum TaxID=357466 RepID=A0AAD4XMA2_9MAGN|nr:hypothetical protein MKW98_015758 [Papaver atlanticum]